MALLFLRVLYLVVVKFFWCTFQLGHEKLKKGRKYQQEWCEG